MIEINKEITLVASNAIIYKPCSADLREIMEQGHEALVLMGICKQQRLW